MNSQNVNTSGKADTKKIVQLSTCCKSKEIIIKQQIEGIKK